jgi:hypothetical protein
MTKAVAMAAMSDPNAKALDIIQTLYRQPDLDENLRAKYLLGAVKFESPPIAPVPPPQPGDSAKLIDVHRSADDVALVAQADRPKATWRPHSRRISGPSWIRSISNCEPC